MGRAASEARADDIKMRIQRERLRVVLAANFAMVQLYWDVGKMILERQRDAGWGAKVIDRLAADLRRAFPEQAGFSPRNLKYMRAFAAAWPDAAIAQRLVAQLPWRQNTALIERLENSDDRHWYAKQVNLGCGAAHTRLRRWCSMRTIGLLVYAQMKVRFELPNCRTAAIE